MSVDKRTCVFSMEEFLSTQEVLAEAVGLVEVLKEIPVVRRFPTPSPLFLCALT